MNEAEAATIHSVCHKFVQKIPMPLTKKKSKQFGAFKILDKLKNLFMRQYFPGSDSCQSC